MKDCRVLVVDDEKELTFVIKDYLERDNIVTKVAHTGYEAMQLFEYFKPDLVILDIMLPDDDGMELCRKIRGSSDVPIIMISAKNADIDKILSLGLGADEYIEKPFSPAVMVAQVKALLRRYRGRRSENKTKVIEYDGFIMDSKRHTLSIDNNPVTLVGKEFDLLWFLASHPYEVFSKETLYDAIWGMDEFGEISTVTVHIRKIRSKIEPDPSCPKYVKTIWGVGYKFEAE